MIAEYVIDRILKPRYFLKGEPYLAYYKTSPAADAQEDWPMLCNRVATVVVDKCGNYKNPITKAKVRKSYRDMIQDLDFLPNSPTLFGAGVPGLTMSACYVIEMTDSIDGWADTFHTAMKVQCAGGGCGFPLHKLRPHGSQVRGKNAKAAGPIEWMHCWNSISQTLRQAVRNGANMGLLRVDHPDIEEFIACKDNKTALTNFNISVGITDAFLKALTSGQQSFDLTWNDKVVKTINPQRLWEDIIDRAWRTGEPGLLFIDEMNRKNIFRQEIGDLYPNPCAEANLFENSACNLGSINLARFLIKKNGSNPASSGQLTRAFDFPRFRSVISLAYQFLDDLIDANTYPTEKISQTVKRFRQIGLGVMGLADVFLALGCRYGDAASQEITAAIMSSFRAGVLEANMNLGKLRGTYPAWRDVGVPGRKLRNFTTSCIAPTGTISQIAGCSSGIEPIFSFDEMDRSIAGKRYVVPGPAKSAVAAANVTTEQLSVKEHLDILEIVQQHVDMSVSKTINLPNSATREEVADAYLQCAVRGIKGVTVYRDGSRDEQTIITKTSVSAKPATSDSSVTETAKLPGSGPAAAPQLKPTNTLEFGNIVPIPRPDPLVGMTHKYKIGCGSLYVTVNKDPVFGRPLEVFVRPGKYGGCPSNVEAIGRLASLGLRTGVKLEELIKQLSGIRCISCISKKHITVTSCADAIGRAIKEQMLATQAGPVPTDVTHEEKLTGCSSCLTPCHPKEDPVEETLQTPPKGYCPQCGAKLRHVEGCVSCICGYSKCG